MRKMSTKKYSQRLKEAIYNMIIMDPTKRVGGEDICNLAKTELNKLKNMLKIDKAFVMEDIYYKLSLLDYEKLFIIPLKLEPLSKIFFVNEEQSKKKLNKFEIFYLLANWLLDSLKVSISQLNHLYSYL